MGKCISYEHIKNMNMYRDERDIFFFWVKANCKSLYILCLKSSGSLRILETRIWETILPEYWRQDPLKLSVLLDMFFWQSHIQGTWTSFWYFWGCLFPELDLSRCLRWPVSPKDDDFSMSRQHQIMCILAAKPSLHS